ncbi:extracellular solute-binding protein [Clostridium sp. MCC353]|uniref:extracellular solute-binding protein n=1 Tax=Clostridium sp. MCC353 TaxID=2592646 RepID=UPI001C0253A2|nr:extracellular solute-binding protein [Clostridium sp. MCC353]MBT9777468.1 extracellular solute-binding protein [Clostridium sp. MCC353]
MKRRIMKLCMAIGAAALMGGCAGQNTAKTAEGTSQEKGAPKTESVSQEESALETEGTKNGEFSYPMETGDKLTWWKVLNNNISLHFTTLEDTPFVKEMTERTGVEIEFLHPPTGQETEQFGLVLADGDLPDLMEYNWLVSYPGGPQKAISDGVVQPLNDIIDQYCPNLKVYLQENPDIDRMIKTDEGQYYAFPMIRGEAETILIGPMMRGDWLEELNLEVPSTVEEWHTVLKTFKEKKGASAPLSYAYTDRRIGAANPIALANVISVDFYLGDDGNVHYGSIEEGYKNYLETFSAWYQEGLVDIDLVSLKKDQVAAKVTSGQAGASVGLTEGNMGAWIVAGRKDNPDFSLVAVPWPTLEEGQRPQSGCCENRYSGISSVAITTSCEDVERAARLMDYMYGEEGHMFTNFGTEGLTYDIVDSYPKFTDTIMKNQEGWTVKSALGAYTMNVQGGPHIADARVPEQTMELPEQLEARYKIWPDTDARKHLLPPITPNSDESKEFATIMNQVQTYRDEMTIKYIMGQESLDTFDNYVENIKKLGIDRAIEIQNTALKRYNER